MAGRDTLDDEGLVDLAEARWRTGDLTGAGEAAAALDDEERGGRRTGHRRGGGGGPRSSAEARRLASRALAWLADLSMPTLRGHAARPIWPIEPGTPPVADDDVRRARGRQRWQRPPGTRWRIHAGLWDDARGVSTSRIRAEARARSRAIRLRSRDERARRSGDVRPPPRARPAPRPGPRPGRARRAGTIRCPELALVKGDAYRLVGHERDARLAFAEAASSIPVPATTKSSKERPP